MGIAGGLISVHTSYSSQTQLPSCKWLSVPLVYVNQQQPATAGPPSQKTVFDVLHAVQLVHFYMIFSLSSENPLRARLGGCGGRGVRWCHVKELKRKLYRGLNRLSMRWRIYHLLGSPVVVSIMTGRC